MSFLAHRDCETLRGQTLIEHLRQVGVLCAQSCKAIGLEKLGLLTGLLHDSGKASDEFLKYILDPKKEQRGKINHSYCGARWLAEQLGFSLSSKGFMAELAALAICGHHSGLPDCLAPDGEDGLSARIYPSKKLDYEQTIRSFWEECISESMLVQIADEAVIEIQQHLDKIRKFCKTLPKESQRPQMDLLLSLTARYVESALIDADRYDTRLFYEEKKLESEKAPLPEWDKLAVKLEQKISEFEADSPVNQARKEISDLCLEFAIHGSGIYQLNVPTGGGKTISSLRYALHTAKKNGFRHIFYIAPYKSILEQNANVIRDILGDSELILEHHGDAVPDTTEEEYNKYILLAERWESPIVLSTMVQFLQTLFLGKSNSVRRFHALAHSVILLDEAQSIPPKFVSVLNCALNYLAEICGCAVILCTATQPALNEVPHPVRLGKPSQMVPLLPSFQAFERTRITDLTDRPAMDEEEITDLIFEHLDKNGSVLAILNTKSAARRVFEAVSTRAGQNVLVFYLSAALCPEHRSKRIGEIKSLLPDGHLICISTQLIEAGVDISFGCVIRSLAGLDSIAQSAGRCNRNGESKIGEVLIVKSADENLSHLPEIREEQVAAESALEEIRRNPNRYPNGILSQQAIDFYYKRYYGSSANLDGPVSTKEEPRLPKNTTLMDLLGSNRLGKGSLQERGKEAPNRPLNQAFQTAGKNVTVIESAGIDVLAPYGMGESLMTQLLSCPYKKTAGLLRKCQRYLVHLYPHEQRFLDEKEGLIPLGDTGMFALEQRFYDEKLGLTLEGGLMDPLLY